MTGRVFSILGLCFAVVFAAGIPVPAQTAPGDFKNEPDKTMAAAHESFMKQDVNRAAEQIGKAADYVKQQSGKVAVSAKDGVNQAGEQLARLGQDVKSGTVKSGDELKKTYSRVDHALARAWHTTAGEAQKTGKDSTEALKNAGTSLEGAARWSGNKMEAGAQASIDAVKKVGTGALKGVKTGSDAVGTWFKGIGQGIEDLGGKL